jgi:hypothetical protein
MMSPGWEGGEMSEITRHAWEAGYAVRREWTDGSHELVGFRWAPTSATRFLDRDRHYWRRGPLRPRSWAVVVVSRRDFDLHAKRHGCRAPDCPTPSVSQRHEEAQR